MLRTVRLSAFAAYVGLDGITAKKLGRMVSVRPDWDDIKLDVMRMCIDAKFDSSASLRQQLVDVTDPIAEDNTWGDTFWGRCNGYGSNYLGQILTQKRDLKLIATFANLIKILVKE